MTEFLNYGFTENEISVNSFGGTELSKRSIAKFIPPELSNEFQVIASRVREINEEKIRVYWQHDLAEDPEVNHLKNVSSRDKFHKLVFVSNWQLNDFVTKLGIPQNDKLQVIENPIETFPNIVKDKNEIRLIYFSTPHRGLELLVPVFEKLAEKYDNIHLDVFSSFSLYGWKDNDKNFEKIFDRINVHPKMTNHGFVQQDVLREYISKAHILAYPNIWKETSCRVLIESMSAGLLCVHPNLASLPETSGGLTTMYQYDDNTNKHANIFYHYLDHAIQNVHKEEIQNYLKFVKIYADSKYDIKKIGSIWQSMLLELKDRYPTEVSRKIPSERFVYKTI